MEVAVFDTYVVKKNGETMHFDIVVPKDQTHEKVLRHGLEYRKSMGEEGRPLTTKECRFCHTEKASEEVEIIINKNGYYIYEMEGCN